MPVSTQKRAEVLQRQQRVSDLHLQGWPQASIAQQMGVAQSTISHDLRTVYQQWQKSAIRNFDLVREIELKKLDRLEREAWAAWERSQKQKQEATISSDGAVQRTTKKVAEQTGDPRFLEQIHKCIASRRALLGLDAPTKIAPTSPDGTESYATHVMAELMRLAEQAGVGPRVIDATFIERETLGALQEEAKAAAEQTGNADRPHASNESDAA